MHAVFFTIFVTSLLLNVCFAQSGFIFGKENYSHVAETPKSNNTNSLHLAFGKPKIIKFTEYSLSVALEYVYKKYPELQSAQQMLPENYAHDDQYVVFSPMGLF